MSLSLRGVLAAALCAALLPSCRRGPRVEQPPAIIETPAPTLSATPSGPPPPPQAAEVQAKVDSVFHGVVHASGGPGTFVQGDFDRDGWNDLAAIADVSADHLADANSEMANWTVQEPAAGSEALEDPRHAQVPPRPTLAAEPVVVLINGFDAAGWRSADARQAYVLKGVAGAGLGTKPLAEAVKEAALRLGAPPLGTALLARAGSKDGFVFFGNGRYWWASLVPAKSAGNAGRPASKPPAKPAAR